MRGHKYPSIYLYIKRCFREYLHVGLRKLSPLDQEKKKRKKKKDTASASEILAFFSPSNWLKMYVAKPRVRCFVLLNQRGFIERSINPLETIDVTARRHDHSSSCVNLHFFTRTNARPNRRATTKSAEPTYLQFEL